MDEFWSNDFNYIAEYKCKRCHKKFLHEVLEFNAQSARIRFNNTRFALNEEIHKCGESARGLGFFVGYVRQPIAEVEG